MTSKRKAGKARPKLILSEAQLEYLRVGNTDDVDVWLDWVSDGPEVRAAFLAVRDDYPPGTFPWAEAKFGGGA